MSALFEIRSEFQKLADPEKAKFLARFFKTGKGEYAEGDIFIGITVPMTRAIIKKYAPLLTLNETEKLLQSKIHEERQAALLILVSQYKRGDNKTKEAIYNIYLNNTKHINNWDLVDVSAEHIVGAFLKEKSKAPLYKMARSTLLWDRRIAILSTFHYIKQGKYEETMKIAQILLSDKHDLIHKAVGWMLREVGKRCSKKELDNFLDKNISKMPRTMLRYAIEKYPEKERKALLVVPSTY